MAIDIASEQVITFAEAAKYCPRRRRGRKPHVSCFYRWSKRGLETIKIGGQLCTSVEALQRFFDRLTDDDRRQESGATTDRLGHEQRRQEKIESELADQGI